MPGCCASTTLSYMKKAPVTGALFVTYVGESEERLVRDAEDAGGPSFTPLAGGEGYSYRVSCAAAVRARCVLGPTIVCCDTHVLVAFAARTLLLADHV